MLLQKFYLILAVYLLFCGYHLASAKNIPAFPGAEGGGAEAIGGRGGRIIEVTNLNGEGPGSLREACEASGPRIVVFRVAGIIDLKGEQIWIKDPYITIAGQTAPGGGILVKGHEISIVTHDVIIRFIRVRTGRNDAFGLQEGDAIGLGSSCDKVIIDHCSVSWSNDENMQIWSRDDDPDSHKKESHNVTISWNLLAEGLTYHHESCGLIVGSNTGPEGMYDISVHHNLFMNSMWRLPLIKSRDTRIINNLVYNWEYAATMIAGGITADIIGNDYKPGPNTPSDRLKEVRARTDHGSKCDSEGDCGVLGNPSIYIQNNLGPNQDDPDGDNWNMIVECEVWEPWGDIEESPDRKSCERLIPMPGSTYPISVQPVQEIKEPILNHVGASMRLDKNGNWIQNRDAVDLRLIMEYKEGTGTIPYDETSVGGYPVINSGTPYEDSDHDAMPNAWETVNGLDPHDASDGPKDTDDDGYTNVEEFLNGTDVSSKQQFFNGYGRDNK